MNEHNYSAFNLLKYETDTNLTPSMEDYLEMIYRILCTDRVARINQLAEKLNVKAPSASKMVTALADMGYLFYEKYGYISLTDDGVQLGKYLYERHQTLNEFLCYINGSDDETNQVEKIEHFLDKRTIDSIRIFLDSLN